MYRNKQTHTHTHTSILRPSGLCPGLPRWASTKTNLYFTEARDSQWQWHQLGYIQICTSPQTDNHTSIPPLSFLQAGCPSSCQTNSVKALNANQTSSIQALYNTNSGTFQDLKTKNSRIFQDNMPGFIEYLNVECMDLPVSKSIRLRWLLRNYELPSKQFCNVGNLQTFNTSNIFSLEQSKLLGSQCISLSHIVTKCQWRFSSRIVHSVPNGYHPHAIDAVIFLSNSWEWCLHNDLFCVKWDVKPQLIQCCCNLEMTRREDPATQGSEPLSLTVTLTMINDMSP